MSFGTTTYGLWSVDYSLERSHFGGSEVMIHMISSFIKISFKKCQNVQSSKFSKKSAGKIIVFSQSLKKSTKVFYNSSFWEDCQGLTITDFSFPRLTLAPVPYIPSLPNSSRNLLPHVLPSSLESSVSASFHIYFLLPSYFTKNF